MRTVGMTADAHDSRLLLGGMTPGEFLAQHWQKRPLLIRQAIPGFRSPISAEELADLACEADVESRLILEKDGESPWQLRHGPFAEEDFTTLPETHWTLLVQEMDKHLPAAAELLERFRFIPDWRIDDVMVSFAPLHGSVGPHVDSYDVFLLQAAGRRHWAIDARPERDCTLVPNLDVRILARFEPQQSWVLEPGDMLYLPPGVPHLGTAVGDCQTWSVGFHAPSQIDMLTAMAEHLAASLDPEARYEDPDLTPQQNPGEITPTALARVAALLRSLTGAADPAEWFGCLVTESRSGLEPARPDEPITAEGLRARLRAQPTLQRGAVSRFAYTIRADGGAILFVDGHALHLGPALAFLAPLLCRDRTTPTAELAPALSDAHLTDLLIRLYNEGHVQFPD
jgi:50S ribosomal protein L16 3-hydroxylase